MKKEDKYTEVLTIRIEPELFEKVKKEAENQGMDISAFIRGCLRTGLYLDEMNVELRSRKGKQF
jgi:predicted DNA binding CopG/RHH family protein